MILRNIAACLAGVFAAGLVIAIVEMAGHWVLGSETEASGQALFAIVAGGYGLGALVASALASRIAQSLWPAIIACAVLALLAVSNLFLITHPLWFVPLAGLLMVGGFFIGRSKRSAQDLAEG